MNNYGKYSNLQVMKYAMLSSPLLTFALVLFARKAEGRKSSNKALHHVQGATRIITKRQDLNINTKLQLLN